MKITKNLTANGDTLVTKIKRRTDADTYFATLFCTGTFASATVTIKLSPDNGTTKVTAKDGGGSDVAYTVDDVKNFATGNGSKNDEYISVYATVSGATGSTDINLNLFDNQ